MSPDERKLLALASAAEPITRFGIEGPVSSRLL
jgi:hypothetical protein